MPLVELIQNDILTNCRPEEEGELKIFLERDPVSVNKRKSFGSKRHSTTNCMVESFQASQPVDANKMLKHESKR
ncbi:hypothetical protein HHI36_014010 [Cryptolaemus montrouzieri]|uniref:Uncharacterized protein n=1 Tax=Cryptolaemus montrouzieri TaxID=559131 RepID=A0ABD2N1J7_9CUCU